MKALIEATDLTNAPQYLIQLFETVSFISDSADKASALSAIAQTQAEAGQIEAALITANLITERADKASALSVIVTYITKGKDSKRALRLVCNGWLQADTMEMALEFLSLSKSFILLKLELGSEFYQAFGWVDDFMSKY